MELHDEISATAAELKNEGDPRFDALSRVVAEMILAQIPKSVSLEACHRAVVSAGAFTLLSMVRAFDENELAGFDAGTLKLVFRERDDSYARIARQILAPWCHRDSAFCGVRG